MAAFESIDLAYRTELESLLYETIVKEARTDERKKGIFEFIVTIEDVRFRTYMSDSDLLEAIVYAIDLLEELKTINNSGLDSASFKEMLAERREAMKGKDEDECKIYLGLKVVHSIYTEKLCEIKGKLAEICCVGSIGFAFIFSPLMDKIIYEIYQQIVDHFDEEERYVASALFILRDIIKMRSEDLPMEME